MNKKYRRAIVAGNWKMNLLPRDVKPYIEALRGRLPRLKTCDVALCVPFPMLGALARAVKGSRIAIGAQNVSEHPQGAFTGEVNAAMLQDIGARFVIVGHSERRAYFGESDETVNEKAVALINAGLSPIICVGETLSQRERALTLDHITYQVKSALSGIAPENMRRVVIAYEPIWAIGTSVTATGEQAQEVCAAIREVIRRLYGARIARGVSILYGGSMNPENAQELLAMPDIDGGLIGGASLDPNKFADIVLAAAQE